VYGVNSYLIFLSIPIMVNYIFSLQNMDFPDDHLLKSGFQHEDPMDYNDGTSLILSFLLIQHALKVKGFELL
jgi:hypothetical protein